MCSINTLFYSYDRNAEDLQNPIGGVMIDEEQTIKPSFVKFVNKRKTSSRTVVSLGNFHGLEQQSLAVPMPESQSSSAPYSDSECPDCKASKFLPDYEKLPQNP